MAHEFKERDLVRDVDDPLWTGVLHLHASYWWIKWDNNNKSSPRFPYTIPFDAFIAPIVRD
jgi:hypothetical protein